MVRDIRGKVLGALEGFGIKQLIKLQEANQMLVIGSMSSVVTGLLIESR